MSLRTKLLGLFGALAIAPLIAISVFDYWRSSNAVRHLLISQTAAVADRVARQARERLELIEGDVALLAHNEETRRYLRTGTGRGEASRFIREALTVVGPGMQLVSMHDSTGRELMSISPPDSIVGSSRRAGETIGSPSDRHWTVVVPVADARERRIGTVRADVSVEAFVPSVLLNDRVGIAGYTAVVPEAERGVATYVERDTAWIASVTAIGSSGLVVRSVAAVDEFAAPLRQIRATNLLLSLGVTAVLALAFYLLAGRVSRPLEALTEAAREIGRGNFSPTLPPRGRDEVGQLASAIQRMSGQIGDMVRQVESSRQMAAIGAFSAQIAHEIRNPLTSIKLNLQELERELRLGTVSPSARRPLEICMEEIERLNKVVRSVLQLGSVSSRARERLSVHDELRAALRLTEAQLTSHGVRATLDCAAADDIVFGDRDRLRGALLNLLLNAVDALPRGGNIRVSTSVAESAPARVIRVHLSDNGPGIAAKDRDAVFEPFYTTKQNGSGIGLAVAARHVESHEGRLSLLEGPGELGGATFVVELPLAPASA